LPTQQKLVLASVLINERNGLKNIQTGQLYDVYDQACSYLNIPSLTQRRISGIISNLDMLGLITARTISRGRYGRSKEINSCIPQNVETQQILMNADENMSTVFNNRYRQQRPL
jgi:cell division control protein 6